MESIETRFRSVLEPLRTRLTSHRVYGAVTDIDALRTLMRHHAFAVWDFMALVKRLQLELAGSRLPWVPPRSPETARMINEIVLDEESDRGPDGAVCSHFELYLRAMDEVGADAEPVRRLVDGIAGGRAPARALETAETSAPVRAFVMNTLDTALNGTPLEVAACFLFGREDVIPDMFRALRAAWPDAASRAPSFVFYLERHIELDGAQHSTLAHDLLTAFTADRDEIELDSALRRAESAIRARIDLWDEVCAQIALATRRDRSSSNGRAVHGDRRYLPVRARASASGSRPSAGVT